MTEDKYKHSRNDGRGLYIICTLLMLAEMYFIKTANSLVLGVPIMLGHAAWRNQVVNGKNE